MGKKRTDATSSLGYEADAPVVRRVKLWCLSQAHSKVTQPHSVAFFELKIHLRLGKNVAFLLAFLQQKSHPLVTEVLLKIPHALAMPRPGETADDMAKVKTIHELMRDSMSLLLAGNPKCKVATKRDPDVM
ncbi:hypothetical protein Q9966_007522 [Columba livia]|nr:hypothetical protein Q9966_007522 [Columba livia]